MLISEFVEVKLGGGNAKYFGNLGYEIPKKQHSRRKSILVIDLNKNILVKIEDLPKESHVNILMGCNMCEKERDIPYREYNEYYKDKQYICKECQHKSKFEEGKKKFEEYNYELLSTIDDYDNCFSLLKYICRKHYDKGIKTITLAQLNQDSGCKECGTELATIKNRKPFEETIIMFKDKGLTLITKAEDYINGDQLLEFICDNHKDIGIQSIRARAIYDGQGCKYCGHEKISEVLRLNYSFVKNKFKEKNLILLAEEHMHTDILVPYICCVHNYEVKYIRPRAVVNEDQGCPECGLLKRSGENHPNWKGGISNLTDYMRGKLNNWKFDSLQFYNFKCYITGINDSTLVIHHLCSYTKILEEALAILNIEVKGEINKYTEYELELIGNKFVELNYQKGLGKPILASMHSIFHSQMGKLIVDNGEFEEFTKRYKNYEFDDLLENKYKYCNALLREII